jgi:hypothetical protein
MQSNLHVIARDILPSIKPHQITDDAVIVSYQTQEHTLVQYESVVWWLYLLKE